MSLLVEKLRIQYPNAVIELSHNGSMALVTTEKQYIYYVLVNGEPKLNYSRKLV